ncbi:hypothetical protein [Chryseobacterium sp. IT-36CA2]|uniref:hypothetical protein n=1 Tax=Chryseobacterium sp. IT-36CA2 TaxID=3026460 RepID=UPI0039E1EF83
MKKKITLMCFLVSSLAFSQVGINTSNPQTTLHVDGGKDNVTTGTPTVAQQLNDFNVTSAGNVGVGTNIPASGAKLDIVGSLFGIKNSAASGSWDNLWFNVTATIPSINASGAESGLQFNVGANNTGTYGDGQTLATVATMMPDGKVGIGTTTPTNTLDVNGTTRIRTINQASAGTVTSPIYVDPTGVIVKSSVSSTSGQRISASITLASGATGSVITGLAQGAYRCTVLIPPTLCGDMATVDFLIHYSTQNNWFAISGQNGLISSPTTGNGLPAITRTGRNTAAVVWSGVIGCADGGNTNALNYTITTPSMGAISITNNGNVSRNYTVIVTRID